MFWLVLSLQHEQHYATSAQKHDQNCPLGWFGTLWPQDLYAMKLTDAIDGCQVYKAMQTDSFIGLKGCDIGYIFSRTFASGCLFYKIVTERLTTSDLCEISGKYKQDPNSNSSYDRYFINNLTRPFEAAYRRIKSHVMSAANWNAHKVLN